MQQPGDGVETEVTWDDQQHINQFGRLNNKFHELEDEIKAKKDYLHSMKDLDYKPACYLLSSTKAQAWIDTQDIGENLEDASNELILADEEEVRYQIGEIFSHVSVEEVETRLDALKEENSQELETLEEEKQQVLAKMADLKVILYGKFKDSINLEEE